MLILGIVLAGLGALLLFLRSRAQSHLLEIRTAEKVSIGEILETHGSIVGSIGPGGFSQVVSIDGTLVCDNPIVGELSGRECAYYTMRIEERYEEEYWEQDSDGRDVRRTRTGSATVADNSNRAQFFIADQGGRLELDADGAKMDLETVVDQFQPAMGGVSTLAFGTFSLDFTPGIVSGRRILGYHYSERILPINRTIYVIGDASDRGGVLKVRRPDDRGKPYIISLKSGQEVASGVESKAKWLLIGAVVSFIAGGVAIVAGLAR